MWKNNNFDPLFLEPLNFIFFNIFVVAAIASKQTIKEGREWKKMFGTVKHELVSSCSSAGQSIDLSSFGQACLGAGKTTLTTR